MSGNQINVNAALDYGTKNTYALTVRASDGNSHTADAAVTISLNTSKPYGNLTLTAQAF